MSHTLSRFHRLAIRRIGMFGALILSTIALPSIGAAILQGDKPVTPSIPTNNPIAALQKRIDSGQVDLKWDERHGWLESVLKALHIPKSSQILVFSKTSFQRTAIGTQTPRAIYFSDDTYVGYVQGGGEVLEISTVDPKLGAVFYLFNQHEDSRKKFVRVTDRCLECHQNIITKGVPGHVIRSAVPQPDGDPILPAGLRVTTDRSPLEERWGGWYVTGTHGSQRHMGNVKVKAGDNTFNLDKDAGANVTDLKPLVDTNPYLTPHSDIVALMVVAHQIEVQNLIAKTQYESTAALRDEAAVNIELGAPINRPLDVTNRRIVDAAEPLVQAMLFVGEVQLTSPVKGTSSFYEEFSALGPKDKKGRSLRSLDLTHRLMKYPCSYHIYSQAFDALPQRAKGYIYRRLVEVLSGNDKSAEFAHFTSADRQSVLEILKDTKPDFATWIHKSLANKSPKSRM